MLLYLSATAPPLGPLHYALKSFLELAAVPCFSSIAYLGSPAQNFAWLSSALCSHTHIALPSSAPVTVLICHQGTALSSALRSSVQHWCLCALMLPAWSLCVRLLHEGAPHFIQPCIFLSTLCPFKGRAHALLLQAFFDRLRLTSVWFTLTIQREDLFNAAQLIWCCTWPCIWHGISLHCSVFRRYKDTLVPYMMVLTYMPWSN